MGIAGGIFTGLIVARRLAAPRSMPSSTAWRRRLAEKRGEAEAARLIARAQTRYAALLDDRVRPARRALRIHQELAILPGLALYQALLEDGADSATALAELDALMASTVAPLRTVMSILQEGPAPFALFRCLEPWVVRLGFPTEGWEMKPVQHDAECVAFDVHRCFYLDTLTGYGAPELTAIFCSPDDVVFSALAPSITWERTMTLGRGHDHCDFR